MNKPVLIGITGGTGSGKTTVAKTIMEELDYNNIVMIQQDSYYKDQSHLEFAERIKTNYDHPFAFDTELLIEHLNELLAGNSIAKPVYDFTKHTRKDETVIIESCDVIILEGILVLEDEQLRDMLDIKIYVDTDNDVRFIRRLLRDTEERERTMGSVVKQYLEVVRPMHQQFIEPTKKYADIIVPEGGYNKVAIDILVTKVKSILEGLD
ncbi:uridine kinase [Orenia marismortui]|uniref:Uridine kinase n=2 Tax=Orenia marismortui TaxID=46469 RepID=A0A4R8GWY8_9FIRM|nr:uridine kinase [Orenia marismortui]TDX46773.1 uridine kinase [Orenia marismortui]